MDEAYVILVDHIKCINRCIALKAQEYAILEHKDLMLTLKIVVMLFNVLHAE